MSRWKRELDRTVTPFEEDLEAGSSGGAETEENEEEEKTGDQMEDQSPPTPTKAQTPFTNPKLGKFQTEEALAEYIAANEAALKAVRTRADNLEDRLTAAPPPQPEADEDFDPKTFFEKPHDVIRSIIKKELTSTVAPLLQDISTRRSEGAWGEVSEKYPGKFEIYRDAVQEQLRVWGIPRDQQTSELIERVFLSEVGNAALSGNFQISEMGEDGRGNGEQGQGQQSINPQLRPSSHPIRETGDTAPKVRLTEEEKRLARIQFGGSKDPESEYIKWSQEENDDAAYVLPEDE
jgi:hypothetical protein